MNFKIVVLLILNVCVASAADCFSKLHWSTLKGQIVVNGQPLVLKGINYYGFQSPAYAPNGLMHQNLDDILDVIKNNNFNAVQVPISMQLIRDNPFVDSNSINCQKNEGVCGSSAMQMLDDFIERASQRGLLVALSNAQFAANNTVYTPELWYDSYYSEEFVIRVWSTLISRYKRQSVRNVFTINRFQLGWNVFAIDLKYEPNGEAGWGGWRPLTDWNRAAQRMIKRLSSFNGLFFVDGYELGMFFQNALEFPIETGIPTLNRRVIYTPHCYGPGFMGRTEFDEENFPDNLDEYYEERFGALAKTGAPVIIGAWGADYDPGSSGEKWHEWHVEWLRRNCITNNFYFSLDSQNLHKVGLLGSDFATPSQPLLELIDRIQPTPTKFKERGGTICITKGSFPERHC